jgi:5'-3' exonuclease
MGLVGFYKLISKKGGYKPKIPTLTSLTGSTFAIDGDTFMYKAMYGIQCENQDVLCLKMANRIHRWLTTLQVTYSIAPLFVVSGMNIPNEKREHASKIRKRKRQKSMDVISTLQTELSSPVGDISRELEIHEKIGKIRQNTRTICHGIVQAVVEHLRKKNIRCLVAESEADFLLSHLSETDPGVYVVTDDADIIVSGARQVLRGVIPAITGRTTTVMLYERSVIMKAIGLDEDALLQLGTLLSCDYQPPIPKVGPCTALNMIKMHSTVASFLHSPMFTCRFGLLPNGLSIDEYVKMSKRTVEIFKYRPDEGKSFPLMK